MFLKEILQDAKVSEILKNITYITLKYGGKKVNKKKKIDLAETIINIIENKNKIVISIEDEEYKKYLNNDKDLKYRFKFEKKEKKDDKKIEEQKEQKKDEQKEESKIYYFKQSYEADNSLYDYNEIIKKDIKISELKRDTNFCNYYKKANNQMINLSKIEDCCHEFFSVKGANEHKDAIELFKKECIFLNNKICEILDTYSLQDISDLEIIQYIIVNLEKKNLDILRYNRLKQIFIKKYNEFMKDKTKLEALTFQKKIVELRKNELEKNLLYYSKDNKRLNIVRELLEENRNTYKEVLTDYLKEKKKIK
jgi:hypothetical protein